MPKKKKTTKPPDTWVWQIFPADEEEKTKVRSAKNAKTPRRQDAKKTED